MARTPTQTTATPAARQGPGPMPTAIVDAVDLEIDRRVATALAGDRRAIGLGNGTELAQIRPYRIGDDVRMIDPAASARTGEPQVRLHVPERTLTTWMLLDQSASMAFGTADRLKADVLEGAALTLGRLALRRAGQLGVLSFGTAADVKLLPPRSSRAGLVALRKTLALGNAVDGIDDPTALYDALGRVGRIARQPGLIVIISDFREQSDWATPLGALRARHAVFAIEVNDPRENTLPDVGRIAVIDPETGQRVSVNTARPTLRARFARIEAERRERLHRELRRLRVDHLPLSTAGDWLAEIGRRLR